MSNYDVHCNAVPTFLEDAFFEEVLPEEPRDVVFFEDEPLEEPLNDEFFEEVRPEEPRNDEFFEEVQPEEPRDDEFFEESFEEPYEDVFSFEEIPDRAARELVNLSHKPIGHKVIAMLQKCGGFNNEAIVDSARNVGIFGIDDDDYCMPAVRRRHHRAHHEVHHEVWFW